MKADPQAQLLLLDLAEIDSRITQLGYAAANIAERAEIARVQAALRIAMDERRDRAIVSDDLSAAVAKAEADVEAVRQRRARDQQRIDDGSVTDPSALQHLLDEITSIDRRVATLEDEELALMEQSQAAADALAALDERVAEQQRTLDALAQQAEATATEIAASLTTAEAERKPLVAQLPAELLGLYDKVRSRTGDNGAALLQRGQCQGCRIALDTAELAKVRSSEPDEVFRCQECSRILVRTASSGL